MLVCLLMAGVNYDRIHHDKVINHNINGFIHIACWILSYLYLRSWHVLMFPFIGRLFFDVILDTLRGKDIGYVSPNPKSAVDKLEKKIWGENGVTPKCFYLLIILFINVLTYA